MRSYKWWQRLLADRYFGPDQDGRPVLFFIDDEVARRLHQEAPPHQAFTDLCSAVAEEAIDWRKGAFDRVLDEVRSWRTRGDHEQPPPCLPVLAVCVLAATRMRSDGGRGARPYYERLAEILRINGRSVDDVREHLKRGYEEVPVLWGYLKDWLDERHGKNGLCTLYVTKGRERIGYAQSQAIMCADDNDRLAPFFERHRGKSGEELLELLRRWPGRHQLSRACREALASNDRDHLIAQLLESLSKAAGKAPPGRFIYHLSFRLAAEDDVRRGWVLHWRIPCVKDVNQGVLKHDRGTLHVAAGQERKYYHLSGDVPDVAAVLDRGFQATGDHLRIDMGKRSRPVVLQGDPAGGWVETERPEPLRPSLIVYSKAIEEEARRLLDKAGYEWDDGERCNAPGWYVLDGIEFDPQGKPRRRKVRLSGGLRVRQSRERRHFMMGGEPDLIPPPDVDVLKIDGRGISTGGKPLRMRGLGLPPGEHTVELGSHRLTFHTHAPRSPARRMKASPRRVRTSVRAKAAVSADGGFTSLDQIADTPVWWRTRGTGLIGSLPQVEAPGAAVWLVTEDQDGQIWVSRLRDEGPRIRNMTPEMKEFWSDLFFAACSDDADRKLWEEYRKMALEVGIRNG